MATLGQAHRFPTIIPLIVANAAPIVGVLFFGWDLLSIMFLYWMETAVVTFYSLLKVVKVGGLFQILPMTVNLVFLGIFMRFHLIFLLWFFGPPTPERPATRDRHAAAPQDVAVRQGRSS